MAKQVKPLNNTQIKNAKPKLKEYLLSDGNGLHLKIMPNGSKLWQFIYSLNKKRFKINLGRYPNLLLIDARAKREEYNALLAQGNNPKTFKTEQKLKQITISDFFIEWFDYWKTDKDLKTIKKCLMHSKKHLIPYFGHFTINELADNVKTIYSILLPLSERINNTTLKIKGYLCMMFDYAIIKGIIVNHNLNTLSKVIKEKKAQHQATVKAKQLPQLLYYLDNSNSRAETKNLILWQLLTMVRPFEASNAQWQEIDFKNKAWNIPANRMKGRTDKKRPHTVPLSSQAINILQEMKEHTGGYKYIFTSLTDRDKPMSSETANTTIKRLNNGKFKGICTAHGLRRTAATYLADQGCDPYLIDACLSHTVGNATARIYNNSDYLKLRRPIMEKWGEFVESCRR